jgi:hypothetical protein
MDSAKDSLTERFDALQRSRPVPEDGRRHYRMTVRHFGGRRAELSVFLPHRNPDAVPFVSNTALPAASVPGDHSASQQETNVERACRRAKQKVRWLVKSIGADHLLTLTYRENMQDVKRLAADWKEFVRRVRKRHSTWLYVMVREYQDRGALHIHCACVGRQDVRWLRACWYAVVGEGQGQINVRGPVRRFGGVCERWNPSKLSGYMCKYMSKDFAAAEAEKKRYWASRGVEIPKRVYWLGATNFKDAVSETYDYVRALGAQSTSLWTSDDWRCIWVDASG